MKKSATSIAIAAVLAASTSGGVAHGMDLAKASGRPSVRAIDVVARSFEFEPDQLTLRAGERVKIVLSSEDIFHNFVVKRKGTVVEAKGHKTKRGLLRIKRPGTYRFWCSVPRHRAAGMEGKLLVE